MFLFFNNALANFRQLRESHRSTTAMVLVLATGIVAATVIFAMMEGVLLRELLFPIPRLQDLFAGNSDVELEDSLLTFVKEARTQHTQRPAFLWCHAARWSR